ncbi:hypothetical protein F3Y22_tig00110450pilonHSYRG01180 [Hibiscus syriacus]|uniref:Uncharacterized protein n=1 Tax=Hibiscus syriacus TaxID=106335 RepID=A0A6A3AKL7_HIBSY|nr:hypothetical protein F3Y22_tig00110450pilonHSYRG01180 [Hibiscus syriacus]
MSVDRPPLTVVEKFKIHQNEDLNAQRLIPLSVSPKKSRNYLDLQKYPRYFGFFGGVWKVRRLCSFLGGSVAFIATMILLSDRSIEEVLLSHRRYSGDSLKSEDVCGWCYGSGAFRGFWRVVVVALEHRHRLVRTPGVRGGGIPRSKAVVAKTTAIIWTMMLKFFANRLTTSMMSLHYKMRSIKKRDDCIRSYLTQIKEVCVALVACGSVISYIEQIAIILNGLPFEY